MKSPKCINITLAPWKWEGAVLVGGDTAGLSKAISELGFDADLDDGSLGHTWVTIGKPIVVWVGTCDVAVLTHELIHAVFGALEARGCKYCHESEEAFTYTVEAALRTVLTSSTWKRESQR